MHTKFHRNQIINEDFIILGVERDPQLNLFLMLSQFSTNIHTQMFDAKFHQNRIINEYFEILGVGGESASICENFQF